MSEYGRRDIVRALWPFAAAYLVLAVLIVWRGYLWAVYGLATAPVALVVLLFVLVRRWGDRSRDQLPDYIVSRTVHALVHDWNRAEFVLRDLREKNTWTLPDLGPFLQAAAQLEPFVGRVRQTGYWEVRRKRFDRLRIENVQAAGAQSRAVLRQALTDLNAQLDQRSNVQNQQLQDLRSRGLYALSPTPVPKATTWDQLMANIERTRDERRAAVSEALRLLDAAPGLDAKVAQIRGAASAAQARGDDSEAIQHLLRLVPAAPKKPAPRQKGIL